MNDNCMCSILIWLISCSLILFNCNETRSQNNDILYEDYGYTEFHFEENLKGLIKKIKLRSFIADEKFTIIKPGQQYSWESDYDRLFAYADTDIIDNYINSLGKSTGYRIQTFRNDGIRLIDTRQYYYE